MNEIVVIRRQIENEQNSSPLIGPSCDFKVYINEVVAVFFDVLDVSVLYKYK